MKSSKIVKRYDLYDVVDGSIRNIIKEPFIEIFNNEQFILDFTNLIFECNDKTIENTQILKVTVDWGDGQTSNSSKNIFSTTSSIGQAKETNWKVLTHTFNVDKMNVYLTDDLKALPKISITLFNSFDDRVTIHIPYKLVYKSIYDIGTDFEMMSGNISDDNHSSFVLGNKADNTLMVVAVKNWKKIYGDDEIVYISDDLISQDYADEYVNEDSIIWNWSEIPIIALHVQAATKNVVDSTGTSKNVTYFKCSFDEKNVNLDEWNPKCFIIKNPNDLQITSIDTDRSYRSFEVFNKKTTNDGYTYENLQNGIYKIYVQMTGINGVSGTSQVVYIKNNDNLKFDKLNFHNVTTNNTQKYIKFLYKLPDISSPKHINYAKLFLKSSQYCTDDDGLSTTYKQEDEIVFSYDLDLTTKEGDYFVTYIPYRDIPNGNYNVEIHIKQITKNNNDAPQICNTVSNQPITVKMAYTNIGSIENVTNKNIQVVDQQSNNVKQLYEISWKLSNPSQFAQSRGVCRMAKMRPLSQNSSTLTTQYYLLNKNSNYQNFTYTVNGTAYTFKQHIDATNIEDGTHEIFVGHMIPMGRYVGQRQVYRKLGKVQYSYPCPQIKFGSFSVYMMKNGRNYEPRVRMNINTPDDRQIVDLQIHHKQNDIKIQNENYYDVALSELGVTFTKNSSGVVSITGYDALDSKYKRRQKNPIEYKITKNSTTISNNILQDSFYDGNQNISLGKSYINEQTNQQIRGVDLMNTSSYNIRKAYKWTSSTNDTVYYSVDKTPTYWTISYNDGESKTISPKIFFKGQRYHEKDSKGTNTILRYVPVIQVTTNKSVTANSLPTVIQYLKTKGGFETDVTYNKELDYITMTISPTNKLYENDKSQINDAIVTLYKLQNTKETLVHQSNLKYDSSISVPFLSTGRYKIKVDFHSVNTNNVGNTIFTCGSDDSCNQKISNLNVKIKPEDVLNHQYSFTNIIGTPYRKFYILWRLNYKKVKDLAINYKIHSKKIVTDESGNESEEWTLIEQGKRYLKEAEPSSPIEVTQKSLVQGSSKVEYWFSFSDSQIDWGSGTAGQFPASSSPIVVYV